MYSIYLILSSFELREVSDLAKFGSLDERQLRDLHERLYEALGPATYEKGKNDNDVLDPFKFVASASMRGESGCASPGCRFQKLDLLNRFGALYATSIVLPIGLSSPEREIGISELRPRLEYACFVLLASRSLVNSGYFIPTTMKTTHHCEHETQFVQETRELMFRVIEDSIPGFAKDFRVRYQKPEFSPSGLPSIYVDGPEDFIEHGSMVYRELDGKEPKLSKRRRYDSEGMTEIKGRDKIPFLWPIFDQIGYNTSFYLAFRMHNKARLMTDLPSEALLLRDLDDDDQFQLSTIGLNALTHSLPLLSRLPVTRLLAIRSENRDAFEAYRLSISKMTKMAIKNGLSLGAASEYFASELLPAIEKIKREMVIEQKKQSRRVISGSGYIAAGLAIGAMSGLPHLAVPAGAAAAVGALVGGNLIKKATESACEHEADLQRQNDLYFLMKVLHADEDP